jgi:hypothetical protein
MTDAETHICTFTSCHGGAYFGALPGWLRIVAVIQGLTAALFVLLVFGKIVASLRPLQAK